MDSQHLRKKTIDAYNQIASHYSRTHFNPSFWQKEFLTFQSLIKGRRVIDVGCGAGRDAILFYNNGFDYTGIDASAPMLAEARKRLPQGNFMLKDFYNLDFPTSSFDGFWASASLLHVPKKEVGQVLKELQRILKPQGVGFISLKQKRDIDETVIKQEKLGGIERFFAFYTKEEFENILKSCGSEILHFHTKWEEDGTCWLCFFVGKKGDPYLIK